MAVGVGEFAKIFAGSCAVVIGGQALSEMLVKAGYVLLLGTVGVIDSSPYPRLLYFLIEGFQIFLCG